MAGGCYASRFMFMRPEGENMQGVWVKHEATD